MERIGRRGYGEENPVRVIDAFVDVLELAALGFDGLIPE
jgi:hypothetical protein